MGKINIEGIEIYAHHGFFKEEQKLGSRFRVDIKMSVDTSKAEKSDDLKDTVNYQKVYELVKTQMKKKSKLLEHIATRIADKIIQEFEAVKGVKVKLSKLSPPINGNIDCVSVVIARKRKGIL